MGVLAAEVKMHDVVEFVAQCGVLADTREILKLGNVNRLGLALDAAQTLPEGRITRLHSP